MPRRPIGPDQPFKTSIKLELTGAAELAKVLEAFPRNVSKRVRKRGLSRASARLRTLIRRDAPRRQGPAGGNLRRAINVRRGRFRTWVGLTTRFYYETLDFESKRGPPLRPWFERSVEKHAAGIAQMIVDATRDALAYEAGKTFARSKALH